MPFDATAPGLDVLLLATTLEMELSERDIRVTSRRYRIVPEHLQRNSSGLAQYMGSALIYPQGSRAIGATIVDGSSDDRFDLDTLLEFQTPHGWTPRRVLDELFQAFQGFPDVQKIVRCTRCVQLQFAFMHLDVTPMDPFPEPRQQRAGKIYHSPDAGGDRLYSVNPFAFAQWFRRSVTMPSRQFQDYVRSIRADMAVPDRIALNTVFADAEIDELPEPIDPLRDAPQVIALKLMKRYLNLKYAKRDRKRPVSIYLSKVAAEVPLSQYGLCAQLEALAAELDRRMAVALKSGKQPEELNPEFRLENFNDRWPKDTADMTVFRGDLQHLIEELARARRSELSTIREIFDELFGERVTEKAVQNYLDGFSRKPAPASYERGKGFLAAPALVAAAPVAAYPVAQVSRVPAHKFHFGSLE